MPSIKTLIVATGNKHKVAEIRDILQGHGIDVRSVADYGGMPDVLEDGDTFEANASKKALAVAKLLNMPVFADDSGLEVQALNGAPGIYSARYSGEDVNHPRNIALLLRNLQGVADRRARFVCVIAVATPQGVIGTARGYVPGSIALAPAGEGGFGYDPVFIPEGYDKTFGELPQAVKNTLSHRTRALEAALSAGLFR